tara:strand:- start:606 stop:728 length:123 start_codon:yes stop_codon:yes gene_type:complete
MREAFKLTLAIILFPAAVVIAIIEQFPLMSVATIIVCYSI